MAERSSLPHRVECQQRRTVREFGQLSASFHSQRISSDLQRSIGLQDKFPEKMFKLQPWSGRCL